MGNTHGFQKNNKINVGKECKKTTRKKIGDAHRGEKCYFWKGGITKITLALRTCSKYIEWRMQVFERDNWTCQFCGDRGHKGFGKTVVLEAHHIIPFSQIIQENNIKNLLVKEKGKEFYNLFQLRKCFQQKSQGKLKVKENNLGGFYFEKEK